MLARVGAVLVDVAGTLVMCGLITYGVFQVAVWAGFIAAGLSVPVVEFKVSWSAKRAAAERAAER